MLVVKAEALPVPDVAVLEGLLELVQNPGHGGLLWSHPPRYSGLAGEARLVR